MTVIDIAGNSTTFTGGIEAMRRNLGDLAAAVRRIQRRESLDSVLRPRFCLYNPIHYPYLSESW